MQLFYQPELPNNTSLPEEESKHCIKVLRHKQGDEIFVTDGRGNLFKATITDANSKVCGITIQEVVKKAEEKAYHIHIAIAPTKSNDRTEWFLEKVMEFGINEISLLQCKNSERVKINLERLQKKAVSAMKQSLNLQLPTINDLQKYPQFIKQQASKAENFIAYVDKNIPVHLKDATKPNKSVCVLIGPEGDFAPEEINMAFEAGFKPITLGKSRLRTETAGIAACHILNLINYP